ncbi:Golgin IMH1 [Hypsizygus marmoreus]|uniref:Golgin IMH1 n=1 Tax=Hypsizygus marmoreus TaxID=39966 RepID=A0A369KEG8_HYPMA|nr:Golgin IMH1 [Hypsizygus marmoreus]
MFSQFRHAVESLAPLPRHSSDGTPADIPRETVSRSNSLDSPLRPSSPMSSSQLAESALVNLRKSLATQRSTSLGPAVKGTATTPTRENRTKSTLEDRLRAVTFTIGEASNATSPNVSGNVTPSVMTTPNNHPLSPPSSPPVEAPAMPSRVEDPVPTDATPPEAAPGASTQDLPTSPQLQEEITNDSAGPTQPELLESGSSEGLDSLPVVQNPSLTTDNGNHATDVEGLQERLKQVEQRFTDVSASFKRLQAEKYAADLVLRELTPLESINDSSGLRDYLQSLASETGVFQDEFKRLNAKLEMQEDRVGELRDTHHLESASQSAQIEKLKIQITETEALLKAAQTADAQAEAASAEQKAEVARLQKDLERAKLQAKEEEEKCVKAISLLKTVRQKLVRAEKEKEDTLKEATALKERDREEKEKDQAERTKLRHEIDAVNAERETAIAGLKTQFDKEVANIKDRYENETSVMREQFELDASALKTAHAQELSQKTSHISTLEHSLNSVTNEKNALFDDLQLRQAELESAQSHLESLQSQNTELQYQLRETSDRYALLKEDFAEVQREQQNRLREPSTSTDEVARLLSTTEAKYESKIFDLKRNLVTLEKERNESEAEWSKKLRDKTRETENLKRVVGSAAKTSEEHEEQVAGLKMDIARLEIECRLLQEQIPRLQQSNSNIKDIEKSWKVQESELTTKLTGLEQQVEESKQRETQLRLANKTLREELRKVQSSAALLERQRNPGVGYWTSRGADPNSAESRTSMTSTSSNPPSRVGSPVPGSPAQQMNDEEVNLEYLRNVILQFLEHKEMRPNLVKVLSIILRFTPQETRRLIAKV